MSLNIIDLFKNVVFFACGIKPKPKWQLQGSGTHRV